MIHEVRGVVARNKGAPVTVETVLVPDPGPGEALVAVQACGVCFTDVHYQRGAITDEFPFLLGHEAAGVVEAVGAGVDTAAINTGGVTRGDSVAVIGCGGPGDDAIAGAALAGATTIIGIDVDSGKLRWATDFGATHTVNARESDVIEAVRSCGLRENGPRRGAAQRGVAVIERVVTSGTFSLDGGTWEVDNNVWLIGDEREVIVVDAAPVLLHPKEHVLWRLAHPDTPPPDAELADGDVLPVAGTALRVVHTPGHSPGSCCLYAPDLNVVFSGDTLFQGGPGATGRSYSNFDEIVASIRSRLLTLPATTEVRTGHGGSTTIGDEANHMDQ